MLSILVQKEKHKRCQNRTGKMLQSSHLKFFPFWVFVLLYLSVIEVFYSRMMHWLMMLLRLSFWLCLLLVSTTTTNIEFLVNLFIGNVRCFVLGVIIENTHTQHTTQPTSILFPFLFSVYVCFYDKIYVN